jgi:hypothetical protein
MAPGLLYVHDKVQPCAMQRKREPHERRTKSIHLGEMLLLPPHENSVGLAATIRSGVEF